MAKRAQPIREDHLERQETAEELRERIRELFKLKHTPDDKTVKSLLSRLEFRGVTITSDAGLLACRENDKRK